MGPQRRTPRVGTETATGPAHPYRVERLQGLVHRRCLAGPCGETFINIRITGSVTLSVRRQIAYPPMQPPREASNNEDAIAERLAK
jgi:hypothetical protein